MLLNEPPLTLGAGPRGVQHTRRWIEERLTSIDRDDLVECATMGVSELVTNALLHGEAPIRVQVRGTQDDPRVEVHDGSMERPVLPEVTAPTDDADLFLTFGRGLSIVARASTAWGAEIGDAGKTVWFSPATAFAEGPGVQGRIDGHASVEPPPGTDASPVIRLHDLRVPLESYLELHRHYRELRREVEILVLSRDTDFVLAQELSERLSELEQPLRAMTHHDIDVQRETQQVITGVRVTMSQETISKIDLFIDLLDRADDFCREERLLSLARSPEQREFQTWFLGEVLRQSRGEAPRPYPDVPAQGSTSTP